MNVWIIMIRMMQIRIMCLRKRIIILLIIVNGKNYKRKIKYWPIY